jgi:hypothetical protein
VPRSDSLSLAHRVADAWPELKAALCLPPARGVPQEPDLQHHGLAGIDHDPGSPSSNHSSDAGGGGPTPSLGACTGRGFRRRGLCTCGRVSSRLRTARNPTATTRAKRPTYKAHSSALCGPRWSRGAASRPRPTMIEAKPPRHREWTSDKGMCGELCTAEGRPTHRTAGVRRSIAVKDPCHGRNPGRAV